MDALLIRIPDAAALLGVSRAKLYELIGSGALPARPCTTASTA